VTWFRVVQNSLTDFDVFLVVSDDYNADVERKIISEMYGFFTEHINIHIKLVSEIPRNPVSGKFQEVICKIKPDKIGQG
jgi:phenylacetate-coenzyme A ligase PaaK-like adenylate-forming protein